MRHIVLLLPPPLLLLLQAIADSAGDWPALVGFLQRRHELPANAPLAAQPRQLLVGVARAALTERLSLGTLRLIFDRLLQVGDFASSWWLLASCML
jgi:hypothetical protein